MKDNFFRHIISQKRGAALIAVLAVSTILLVLIKDMWADSQLEHSSSYQQLAELKSRYSSKSGIEISLLRLYIYKEIEKKMEGNEQIASFVRPYIDKIWSTPFIWPFPMPEDLSDTDKRSLQDFMDRSFLKESYKVSIHPEDGHIDINDLAVPIDYLRQFTLNTLFNFLTLSLQDHPKLKDQYTNSDIREILNNISDWVDGDNDSQNGGSETTIENNKYPLNRSFISVEEIKQVPGVTEDIFNLLKEHITTYGSKGLNINYASKKLLLALNIPEIIADDIYLRTNILNPNYAPFLDLKTFCNYLTERGLALCEEIQNKYQTREMLHFNTASHFHLKGVAQSKNMIVQSEVLVYDPLRATKNYKNSVSIQNKILQEDPASSSRKKPLTKKEKKKKEEPLALPSAIANRPFFIMYWKENL